MTTTTFDAAADRVLAADPALYVTDARGAVLLAQPALHVSVSMSPDEAEALAGALRRAARRARGEARP